MPQVQSPARDSPPRRATGRFATWLAAISVSAFVIRLIAASRFPSRLGGDPEYYHTQANLLAEGHGFAQPVYGHAGRFFATAFHPPVYSLVLSVGSLLGGTSVWAHQVLSCLIGTGTVILIALLARLVAGNVAGIVAGGIAAVYPNLWVIDGLLFSEDLAAALVALVLIHAYLLRNRPAVWRAAVLGGSIALAALTRPEAVAFVVLIALPVTVTLRAVSVARRWQLFGVALASMVVILAPWFVRNLTSYDQPVLFSTNGDAVLGMANCPKTYSGPVLGYWNLFCGNPDPKTEPAPLGSDESVVANKLRDQGLRYVKAHVERFVGVVIWARVGRTWSIYRPLQTADLMKIEGRKYGISIAGLLMYWLLVPAAIFGVVALHRRRAQPAWPLLMPFLVVTAVSTYAYGTVRFRAIAEPALIVLAATGASAAFSGLRLRLGRSAESEREVEPA